MGPASELDQPLLPYNSVTAESIDRNLRSHIISTLWTEPQDVEKYTAYFNFFAQECDAWRLNGLDVAINTYRDFLNLVQHLRSHRGDSKCSEAMMSFFSPLPPQQGTLAPSPRAALTADQRILNAIHLTVCLWLMLRPWSPELTSHQAKSTLEWKDTESLDDFIHKAFPKAPLETIQKETLWQKPLNLYTLNRIGGFDIIWTNHLADHLYLDEDVGSTIHLYHHACVLESHSSEATSRCGFFHLLYPRSSLFRAHTTGANRIVRLTLERNHSRLSKRDTYKPKRMILPQELLYETQQTLALLLPARSRSDCKTWFHRIHKRYPNTIDLEAADLALGSYGRVQANFPYWHERLSVIQRTFDDAEPKGLSQWWHDRRKKVQWYTFWVAILILILTIVFGLIQSITGVMQVYAAYHPVSSD